MFVWLIALVHYKVPETKQNFLLYDFYFEFVNLYLFNGYIFCDAINHNLVVQYQETISNVLSVCIVVFLIHYLIIQGNDDAFVGTCLFVLTAMWVWEFSILVNNVTHQSLKV